MEDKEKNGCSQGCRNLSGLHHRSSVPWVFAMDVSGFYPGDLDPLLKSALGDKFPHEATSHIGRTVGGLRMFDLPFFNLTFHL